MATIVCPECGKDDMVQKVSAIYSDGVSTISYQQPVAIQTKSGAFYGNIDKTAVNSTALARRLAPPPMPKEPGPSSGCVVVSLIVGLITALYISISLGLEEGVLSYILFSAVAFFIPMGLLGMYYKPALKEHKEKLMPEWAKARQKWLELYYCSRNDCVFNPDTSESVPPEKMSTLLN